MRRLALLALAALVAILSSGEALAGSLTYQFAFSDGTISVSGTLDATLNTVNTGEYTVNSATANLSGNSDSGTLKFNPNPDAPKADPFYQNSNDYYDDQLFPADNPSLTNSGLLFTSSNGTYINIYYNTTNTNLTIDYFVYFYDPNSLQSSFSNAGSFSLSPASVPEPSALLLAATALSAIAAAARRRRSRMGR